MSSKKALRKNTFALVTGGTSGIGYEIAKLLAKDGYNLAIVARSNERLQAVTKEFQQKGVKVIPIDKDLSDPGAAIEIYQEMIDADLEVEILVNNAAQGQKGKFVDISFDRHLELINLNISTVVTLTKLFLDDMVERGKGRILNVASVVSKTPAPEFSVYAATKAFILSFSEALAQELEGTNISVTALLPGRTDTDFFYKADMTNTKEYQDHSLADPATVAHDGYEAMMKGERRIISGTQNKMTVGMMNAKPDASNAVSMQKNMQPTDKSYDDKRRQSKHPASRKERDSMNKEKA